MFGSSSAIRTLAWLMAAAPACARLGRRALGHGSSNPKQAPRPGSERSHMRPPKCSTMLAADRQAQAGALRPVARRRRPGGTSRTPAAAAPAGTPGPLSSTSTLAPRGVGAQPHAHPAAARRHELRGVRQQVQQHLQQPVAVGLQRRHARRAARAATLRAALAEHLGGGLHRLRQQRAQVDSRRCATRRGPIRSSPCRAPG